jgi:predicted O-linked N-acetylglucosamine transferase (SPINDLY family)
VCGRQSVEPHNTHGGFGTFGGAGAAAGASAGDDDDDDEDSGAGAGMGGRCYNAFVTAGEPSRPQPATAQSQTGDGRIDAARQLFLAGRRAEAEELCRQIIADTPRHADALNLLGVIALSGGRLAEAEDLLRRAIAANPESAEAHNNLGEALRRVGRLDEAATLLARAMILRPRYPQAARNLTKTVDQLDHAGLVRLGEAFAAEGQTDAASECFRRAVEREPDDVAAVFNYGNTLELQGRVAEAVLKYERAQQLHPRDSTRVLSATRLPVIYESREELLAWRQRLRDNLDAFRRDNFRLDVTRHAAPNLFLLAYHGLNDRDLMRDYAALVAAPPAPPVTPRPRDPRDERIQVGFISFNLKCHTIGRINQGLIAQLDREKFHVTVFQLDRPDDPESRFIRAHAEEYVEIPATQLPAAREEIAKRGVDVLFYTDIGMENYAWTLAHTRLAPVQAVTWGHPSTTGVPAVDYYVSSELLESDAAQEHYTEQLIKLPNLSVYYYRPHDKAAPPPVLPREDVHVYGCLQNLFKLHPDFDAIMDDILRRDPKGVILLPHGATRYWDEALMRRLARTMPQTVSRVSFFETLPYEQYLGLSAACDVLLAPIHFGAGNTSYEAFAFGTPTVTMPSEFLKGRITHGLYRAMGVMDCVAATPQQYAELAVRLGTDRDFNRAVRERILAANHVLYENPAGVRDLENFFIDAVRRSRA